MAVGVGIPLEYPSSGGKDETEPISVGKRALLERSAILTSDRFVTALQSVLPRAEAKADGSMDQLPFILTNIQKRRASGCHLASLSRDQVRVFHHDDCGLQKVRECDVLGQ